MPELRDATVTVGIPGINGTGVNASEKTDIFDRLEALEALTPPAVIGDLGDVDTTTTPPVTGDILQFDGTNWVPYTPQPITVPFTFPFPLDGGGSAVSGTFYETGVLVNFAGTITGWHVQGTETLGAIDPCNLVVKVQKATSASPTTWVDISGTEKPTLTNQSTASDLTLTTWDTAIANLNRFRIVVESGTAKFATVTLLCEREIGP